MRILFVGDSPTVDTGFGIVSKNLLNRWHAMGHEIGVLGVNHFGGPYDQKKFPYPIQPTSQGGMDNMYGVHKLPEMLDKMQPHILFILNDPWIIDMYLSHFDKIGLKRVGLKYVGYYPTDAGPIKPRWAQRMSSLDAQVVYSNFAERVVTEANGGKRPPNMYQVYHGVDTNVFRPINQSEARRAMGLQSDAFIVGMVARNQFRKRFDILIKGFGKFAKDKPSNVRLYLHTALEDVGYDIMDLAQQFDVDKKLIITEGLTPAKGVDEEELNIIYNVFDVNTLISLGDGFGLPVAESMATGCPQLVSDHSCLKELVDGHGGLTVKTESWIMNATGINTWGGVSDPDDLADKLQLLYENRELRLKLAEDAYNYIRQPVFTWDYAASKFDSIFKKLYHII